ncbi:16S rRNA (uracil(1498)-N(3))-methyltransferase [Nonlabens marinus]|uniref:Ribosomal RNA small subunit methyltransferase E n=1 Tax=Nonlabens marinus S1-08 TaxID=1454201 RepID=W8VXH1_9FLAO|nr:16S rRNA (uracil(1498)-N(3))-methyltransferase [Nonlabens marinus]BAO55917.1 ribosomal RNA small subunit methyltransferase E [Nonlabens marinus S1-08]
MQLFYFPQATATTTLLSLEKEDTRHITKVLRKKVGDQVSITNGTGDLFDGTITQLTSNKCSLKLQHVKFEPAPSGQLHIAIAPTKMNDRMEWFLEKSTELGITEITPLLCSNSERRSIKWDRFDKILVSAMKQSLQLHKPKLNELTSLEEFMETESSSIKLIAHCEQTQKKHLSGFLEKDLEITLLIGPEGDFTPQEIEQALVKNYQPVHLGATRLRTETAGVYAASLFNAAQQQS